MLRQCGNPLIIAVGIGSQYFSSGIRCQLVVKDGRLQLIAIPVHIDWRFFSCHQCKLCNLCAGQLGCQSGELLLYNLSAGFFQSRPAAEYQRSALLHVLLEHFHLLIIQNYRMRVEQYGILFQFLRRSILTQIHKVHRGVRHLRGCIQSHSARVFHCAMPYIQFCIEFIVVCFQNADLRLVLSPCELRNLLELLVNICNLPDSAIFTAAVIQNAMPVYFRAHRAGSPAEIADIIRTVCDALHGPQCNLSWSGRRRLHCRVPSVCTGLLLHDAIDAMQRANLVQVHAPHAILELILFNEV